MPRDLSCEKLLDSNWNRRERNRGGGLRSQPASGGRDWFWPGFAGKCVILSSWNADNRPPWDSERIRGHDEVWRNSSRGDRDADEFLTAFAARRYGRRSHPAAPCQSLIGYQRVTRMSCHLKVQPPANPIWQKSPCRAFGDETWTRYTAPERCEQSRSDHEVPTTMALNKKQQKQIEAVKNKIQRLRQLLNAAKNQPDDPKEAPRLEKEIAALNAEIEKIKSE